MTSLFFIMMVMFGVTVGVLVKARGELVKDKELVDEIKSVQVALDNLDTAYFEFDSHNKRYKLIRDILFKPNSSEITDIGSSDIEYLKKAGEELFQTMSSLIHERGDSIDYLLVVEGNTQRVNENYIRDPDAGYKLSYNRALSLVNYWKQNEIDFYQLAPQCEIIIAGSGYFGQSRDPHNERSNRKFSIQVTSKVGKYLEKIQR